MTLKELRLPVLILSACLAAASALLARDEARVTEKSAHSYPLNASGTLALNNLNGDIVVVAWDRNEVVLEAEKFARDEEHLSRIEIVVDAKPDKLVVKSRHHKVANTRRQASGGVRYRLRVPATLTQLKIDGMNSTVKVEGVRGDVKLNTMNGRIEAHGLAGNANLDTMNGNITASFVRVNGSQKINLDSMNGSCTVLLPSDASARVEASTMNGRTRSEFPITVERSSRRSLRGSIGGGEASIDLESMNGSLTLRSRDSSS